MAILKLNSLVYKTFFKYIIIFLSSSKNIRYSSLLNYSSVALIASFINCILLSTSKYIS